VITRIARKEFVELWRDGRFRASAVVILVLVAAALAGGWRHASRIAAEHDEARRATRTQWLNQPAKNPHSAAHYGVYAFKPQTPLAAVDTGIDAYVGVAAWLEAHRQNEFRFRPAADRASIQRFGDFTAATVLQTLLPLVIVLVGFAAFAGEREAGTLRQIVSMGVPLPVLMTGKAVGVGAAIALVVVPAVALGAVAVSWSNVSEVWDGDGARTAALAVVYAAWAAIWIGGTLAVSAAARTARRALVSLLAAWMGITLVAPRLASEIAAVVHPTPSAAEFQRGLDADLADRKTVEARLEQRRRELFARHGVTSEDALPINFSGISLQEGEEHANEVFDKHFGQLYGAFERQNRLAQYAGFVAPSLALRSLSMGLSGSDFAQHRHFATAAEAYRRDIQRAMNGDIARHQKRGETYLASRTLWAEVPDFDYRAPSAAWVAARQWPSLVAIAGWLVLAGAAAWLAARRSRVVA
jgi:ABC-2 type transport system permease protein